MEEPKEIPEVDSTDETPSLTVSQLTFSDGTSIGLGSDDIVVFVGPNNAGKSASLKEIEAHLSRTSAPAQVIKSIETVKSGTTLQVETHISNNSHTSYPSGHLHYTGNGYSILAAQIDSAWKDRIDILRGFFCRRLKTETRIVDSDPAPSFKVLSEAASRPIQIMYSDNEVENRISSYFKAAYDSDLIVMRAGGSEIPLLVGDRIDLLPGEDPTKRLYLERLMAGAGSLKEQGDGMRSFASVILEMLASKAPSMLLLDEPEAFLHPPQARLLGEFLALERRAHSQIFIATHSPDVLLGLLNVAPEQLRVIRIQRIGGINHVKELEKDKAKEISTDPLMKYSLVLSGVFHQRAIICEADADCLFYQALLANPNVHNGPRPDVLFLHASGKHRMATMAEALRSLGVPVDVIADIDLLSEEHSVRKLVHAMGGSWGQISDDWRSLKLAVESRKAWLNAGAIRAQLEEILVRLDQQADLPRAAAESIKSVLKKSSAWGALKEAGDAAIPSGEPTKQMQRIRTYLETLGIWIVPVGELEGFYKAIGGHGPKWVQKVIGERDINTDKDLEDARKFIGKVWNRGLNPPEIGVSNERQG